MKIDIPEFATKKELFSFLRANKSELIKQKKLEIRKSDTFSIGNATKTQIRNAVPPDGVVLKENELFVRCVMNTLYYMDSHHDVHVSGIWNKTLQDNATFYHLQEHSNTFKHVICDNSKAYMTKIKWSDLGYDYKGDAECLMFDSIVDKNRNEFMYNQYKNRWVKNHSVGMWYVKLDLAINDEESEKEFDLWNKYIDKIVNKEVAIEAGFFWVIPEAKLIEGSAVVFGSNGCTPTHETIEPSEDTQDVEDKAKPLQDTSQKLIDYIKSKQF